VSSLLPEAQELFRQEKYRESVLCSAAALEYAIKSKLGVSLQHGWRNLTDIIVQKMGASNAEKLSTIIQIRNNAVHSTLKAPTEEESKVVLEASEDLINQLKQGAK